MGTLQLNHFEKFQIELNRQILNKSGALGLKMPAWHSSLEISIGYPI